MLIQSTNSMKHKIFKGRYSVNVSSMWRALYLSIFLSYKYMNYNQSIKVPLVIYGKECLWHNTWWMFPSRGLPFLKIAILNLRQLGDSCDSPETNSSLIIFKNIQRKNHLLKPKNKITSGVVSESHSLWTKRHFVPPKYITFAKKVNIFWDIPFLNAILYVTPGEYVHRSINKSNTKVLWICTVRSNSFKYSANFS